MAADNNDLSDISESKSSLIAHRTLVEFRPMPSPTGDELWEHFVGEFMMTFLLVFSGLETAVNSDFDHLSMACFAIGLTVFLGYSLYVPIDGCSTNPISFSVQLS